PAHPRAFSVFPYTTLFRSRASEGDELVDGDGQRRVVAEDVVAGGVADEQEIDAGTVEDRRRELVVARETGDLDAVGLGILKMPGDRKSTRLNSSHVKISYA